MPRVEFFSEEPVRGLNIRKLRNFTSRAAGELSLRCPVNVVLTGSQGIKKLNRRFFSKTGVTDVMAFDLGRPPLPVGGKFCEIYVCLSEARKAALRLGHGIGKELRILIVHGLLHLSGMDDLSPSAKNKMLEAGDELVNKLER